MIINEERGDLFKLDKKYALAHCISQDCGMGQGIVVEFNRRYPSMKSDLIKIIKESDLRYPITIPYFEDWNPKVFNLVTKQRYWGKPTYDTIKEYIKQMVHLCKEYNIKYLAMPRIGCGLDKLSWYHVKEIIKNEFKDLDIEIEVRYL